MLSLDNFTCSYTTLKKLKIVYYALDKTFIEKDSWCWDKIIFHQNIDDQKKPSLEERRGKTGLL